MNLLHISADAVLAQARRRYLRALGFGVSDVQGMASILAVFNYEREFDAVILCHTLSASEKLKIAEIVCANWAVPLILELYLAEPPVTRGIGLEADTEFQQWMIRWAETPPALAIRKARGESLGVGIRHTEDELGSTLMQ